ncbi:hypothetical protein EAO77_02285 [Streptomyces sp. t39]|nr:hypothetical protein EAO77_02285 [Streptomyces sp. t39]
MQALVASSAVTLAATSLFTQFRLATHRGPTLVALWLQALRTFGPTWYPLSDMYCKHAVYAAEAGEAAARGTETDAAMTARVTDARLRVVFMGPPTVDRSCVRRYPSSAK